MARRTLLTWLLTGALALTACTTPPAPVSAPPPAAPEPTPVAAEPAPPAPASAKRPTEPPGWRFITAASADMRLISSSPDGSGFYMTSNVIGDRAHDLLVAVGDPMVITKPPVQRVTFATPAHTQVDIVDLPWGKVTLDAGSDRGNEGGAVVAPDLRHAVVQLAAGLWLGDLQTGEGRIITSPRPEEWPPDMGYRNPLQWAISPRWSADSQWIYFQTNRQKPYVATWWRIPAAGGTEEPVAGDVLSDQGPVAREVPAGQSVLKQIQADGFFFRSFSPDGQWAAADKTEAPMFRLYNLQRPEASITYTDAPDRYAGVGFAGWAPGSEQVLFHSRAVSAPAPLIGVLDRKAGGTTSFYAFPDPQAGMAVAAGFVGSDHLLVFIRPWSPDRFDVASSGETQWWLLDRQAAPTAPRDPTRLFAARLFSPPYWQQMGQVTGGDVAVTGAVPLTLRFDTPVSAEWLQAHVQIQGSGARLETRDASLGIATVTIAAGAPGDNLRIRVPSFGFDLQVRRTEPLTVQIGVRQGDGPWTPLDPGRVWPRQPLDLRFTFNRLPDETLVADRIVAALQAGESAPRGRNYKVTPQDVRWEAGALVLHIAEPVPLLVFSLVGLTDRDGLPLTEPMRLLRTGSPPVLVTAGGRDQVITQVPVEITDAVLSADGKEMRFTAQDPKRQFAAEAQHLVLNLATGQITPGTAPSTPAATGAAAGTASPATPCKVQDAGNFRRNPTGDQLLYNRSAAWGTVEVLNLTTCQTTDLGPGLPVGWDPQGRILLIRWADSRDRFQPDPRVKW